MLIHFLLAQRACINVFLRPRRVWRAARGQGGQTMAASRAGATRKRRTASKAVRREQLIKATIRAVARRGLAGITLADVASEAKLSQGIINLHFESKDKLLIATLQYLADGYKSAWERALARAGPSPAEQVAAMVELDFSRGVCDRDKLGMWFAFWGEARSRPTYRKLCAERDRDYLEVMRQLCGEIADDGYPAVDADNVATGLAAMCEGLWLDLLLTPQDMSKARARQICHDYLAAAFPRHFPVKV